MTLYETPGSGAGTTSAPQTVTIAYWLYIVGAILGIVGAVIVGVLIPASIAAATDATARSLQGRSTNGVDVSGTIVGLTIAGSVVSIVLSVVFSILFLVFARRFRAGRNWARVVLAVLAGIQLFGVLGAYGLGAVHFLVVAAALVLSFLPASSAWFREVKATAGPLG